jgi:hypothetical protein
LIFRLLRLGVVDSLRGCAAAAPSGLIRPELEALLVELFVEVAALKQQNSEQRAEIGV